MDTTPPIAAFERTDAGWIPCNGTLASPLDQRTMRMVLLRDNTRRILLLYHKKYSDSQMALHGLYTFKLERGDFVAGGGWGRNGMVILESPRCIREFGYDAPKTAEERQYVRQMLLEASGHLVAKDG